MQGFQATTTRVVVLGKSTEDGQGGWFNHALSAVGVLLTAEGLKPASGCRK
jgi:hypothetical protein